MKDTRTPHQQYPTPNIYNRLQDDVTRIAAAITMTDEDIHTLIQDTNALEQDVLTISQDISAANKTQFDYVDGRLMGMTESLPGGTRTTTYTYDPTGKLKTQVSDYRAVRGTTTYHYTNDVLTGTSYTATTVTS